MKKILSTVLAAALLVGTLALGAMSASAAELEATSKIGDQTKDDPCGFIDSNVVFGESLKVESLTDVKIEVNGKPAYWNIGYMGMKHCQLGKSGDVDNNWIQIGIVGAAINGTKDEPAENTIKLTIGSDTYEQTFKASFTSKGVTYSKVDADKTTKTVTAVITYNEAPGYKKGDELTGKCHDDHGNTGTFKVTAVDGNTVTLKAENYVPAQSLLELVDKDGVYTSVTINTAKVEVSDPQALAAEDTAKVVADGTKQTLSNVTSKDGTGADWSDAAKLVDGQTSTKIEGNFPSGGLTVTFETEKAVKATYLVLYTHDDDQWKDRAPQAFTLYGSTDGKDYKVIKDVLTSGIKNEKETPFAFALKDAAEYKYYKLEVHSNIGGGYFQISELELYTGNVAVSAVPAEGTRIETQATEGFTSNGTAPATSDPTKEPEKEPEKDPTTPKPVPTGDVAVVLTAIALVAVAGAVVVAKKRKIED